MNVEVRDSLHTLVFSFPSTLWVWRSEHRSSSGLVVGVLPHWGISFAQDVGVILSACVYVHFMHAKGPQRAEERHQTPRPGDKDNVSHDVVAWNQTLVLCKSSEPLSCLSSPSLYLSASSVPEASWIVPIYTKGMSSTLVHCIHMLVFFETFSKTYPKIMA